MLFSTSIPDKLQEYPNASAFMSVLDALQDFKTEIIAGSFRVDNSAVLMDRKWLLKKLDEFGVTDMPLDYPIQIMRQYLLNVDTVCRTRGSKKGIELYCSLLSFGEVTVDDSNFYKEAILLLLDSTSQGFITEDSSKNKYHLCENSDTINQTVTLTITIKSRYFNGQYPDEAKVIKSYLENTIGNQLGFSPDKKVTFKYQSRSEFYFHNLLNPYFV